ncbi:ribonuclease P protein component [Pseudoxanthomonas japonensis]|uniref:ribonuclease P protein component n=1 Tax=Pseudoxanthomonas japonensis TaxID=69284 RepID=UPI002863A791|nr:ribonuclease P protein component [Pseudoxanthomonas japonensis]MDR7068723.1 ribonuclease P protein component [Pseudoxanthomonas japonensis]
MTTAFPRSARVRASAEYSRVFEQARRTSDPLMSLHWLPGDGPARLGLAVSRKVDTRAVGRNRIKRQLREHFRRLRDVLPGGDYVVVARPPAAKADTSQLRATFERTLTRAGALPAPAPGGTMPPGLNSPAPPPTPSSPTKPVSDAG